MRLALAQIAVEAGAVARNVDRAVGAVQTAADRGADLVVLPEMFTVGYFAFDRYAAAAEPLDGESLTAIAAAARERDVAVLAGSVVEDLAASAAAGFDTPADAGYANAAAFFDRSGERRAVYRKHHLFGYGSAEADLLVPGRTLPTVDFEGFTVAATTCYDLRFPELYRDLVDRGATLFLVPSAWPAARVEHWRLLPRARAVENLAYVAATNAVGTFADADLPGRSAVYDPWGETVAAAGGEPTVLTADLSPDQVDRVREEFPALADRR